MRTRCNWFSFLFFSYRLKTTFRAVKRFARPIAYGTAVVQPAEDVAESRESNPNDISKYDKIGRERAAVIAEIIYVLVLYVNGIKFRT